MTTTETEPTTIPDPKPAAWIAASSELRGRFPGTKDTILFCIHALDLDPEIDLDALKARASAHGLRVTAASLTAARRLLNPDQSNRGSETPTRARQANRGRPARARTAELDPEALIRGVVQQIEQSRNVEADRMRDGIRKAIRLLETTIAD